MQKTTDKSKTRVFKSVEIYNATNGIPKNTILSNGKYFSGLPSSAQVYGHCGLKYDKLEYIIYGASYDKYTRYLECKNKGYKEYPKEGKDKNI